MAEDGKVWPMVMSVGYNPYFKNEKVTAVSPYPYPPRTSIVSVVVFGCTMVDQG